MDSMLDPTELGGRDIRRFTRREFERMVEVGIIDEDDRIELLHGWVVRMSPIHPPHSRAVNVLTMMLVPALLGRAMVSVQCPFAAGPYSLPQPDLAVVPLSAADDERHHPHQASLVIEVADSSLPKDRRIKAPLYARAGIPEYWIVNVRKRNVEVHRAPRRTGYGDVRTARSGETLSLLEFPDVVVPLARLFPRRSR